MDADLTLADRVFQCQNPNCGLILDRDLNAARNLAKLAGSSPDRQNACGAVSAGRGHVAPVKLAAVKQEPNTSYSSVDYDGQFWRTVE